MSEEKWVIRRVTIHGTEYLFQYEGCLFWKCDPRLASKFTSEEAREVKRDNELTGISLIRSEPHWNGEENYVPRSVRTYTADDIERIVAIAAQHQREACETRVPPTLDDGDRISKLVINAPAPSAAVVLAEFEKSGNPNGDTQ